MSCDPRPTRKSGAAVGPTAVYARIQVAILARLGSRALQRIPSRPPSLAALVAILARLGSRALRSGMNSPCVYPHAVLRSSPDSEVGRCPRIGCAAGPAPGVAILARLGSRALLVLAHELHEQAVNVAILARLGSRALLQHKRSRDEPCTGQVAILARLGSRALLFTAVVAIIAAQDSCDPRPTRKSGAATGPNAPKPTGTARLRSSPDSEVGRCHARHHRGRQPG